VTRHLLSRAASLSTRDTEAEVAEYTPELVSEQQEEPRNVLRSGEGILARSCQPASVLDLLRRAVR